MVEEQSAVSDGGREIQCFASSPVNLTSYNFDDTISLIPANQYLIKTHTISSPSFEAFLSSQNYQQRAALFARTPRCGLLLNSILLCGDINMNPGPVWKYPCRLCKSL